VTCERAHVTYMGSEWLLVFQVDKGKKLFPPPFSAFFINFGAFLILYHSTRCIL
jgi:hypothetical protein